MLNFDIHIMVTNKLLADAEPSVSAATWGGLFNEVLKLDDEAVLKAEVGDFNDVKIALAKTPYAWVLTI